MRFSLNIFTVTLSEKAKECLRKMPKHIINKLMGWVEAVNNDGVLEVRKLPEYHNEPLSGKRKGQR